MKRDLSEGFAGVLDHLTDHARNDLFLNPGIFATHPVPDLIGELEWWDGETRGNWLDGLFRMAAYTGNNALFQRIITYLEQILEQQEKDDGYIGIYEPPARFNRDSENGELWTASRMLLILIAAYEFTDEKRFLAAAERAIACIMSHYGPEKKRYWTAANKKDFNGVTHGLQIIDVLERLFDLTGKKEYKDFAVWCWESFSNVRSEDPHDDYYIGNLLDSNYMFYGHAAHSAEHLRAPLLAYYLTGDTLHGQAYRNAYEKIARHELMTGSILGEENIAAVNPAANVGYEYCTTHEYLDSLLSEGQKSGQARNGDKAETLLFNAAQGNRTPDGKHVNYLGCEDAYDKSTQVVHRYKYSPTHEDVAVCCNPNATKILSYYVSRMWMKVAEPEGDGLVAYVYGPSEVETAINGVRVAIREKTRYPFEEQIAFEIVADRPVRFPIWLRIPEWAEGYEVEANGAEISRKDGYCIVTKAWESGDELQIVFHTKVSLVSSYSHFVRRGPLYYCLPVEGVKETVRSYGLEGFDDFHLIADSLEVKERKIEIDCTEPDCGFTVERVSDADPLRPWDRSPIMLKRKDLTLVPYGCARLRRCSFDRK